MKAAFFWGRVHHAIKLAPIIIGLGNKGVDVEVITTDNSINIDPPNAYFKEFNLHKFNHAKEYITGEDMSGINAMVATSSDIYSLGKMHQTISPFWMASSLREAAENFVGFKEYLSTSAPDFIFALHEQNFFAKILFYIAHNLGIPTYSLQEGIILEREEEDLGRYSSATSYTTKLFSWSERDRQFYADSDKIVPVGPTHLDEAIKLKYNITNYINYKAAYKTSMGFSPSTPMIALVPPRLDLYAGDFLSDAKDIASWTRNKAINVVIRLHPFQGDEAQNILNSVLLSKFAHIKIDVSSDGIPCIFASDAVITQTSTVGLEAAALGTPLMEIDFAYQGIEQPLHRLGGATLLERGKLDTIDKVIRGVFDIDAANNFKQEYLPLADGNSVSRILNEVLG